MEVNADQNQIHLIDISGSLLLEMELQVVTYNKATPLHFEHQMEFGTAILFPFNFIVDGKTYNFSAEFHFINQSTIKARVVDCNADLNVISAVVFIKSLDRSDVVFQSHQVLLYPIWEPDKTIIVKDLYLPAAKLMPPPKKPAPKNKRIAYFVGDKKNAPQQKTFVVPQKAISVDAPQMPCNAQHITVVVPQKKTFAHQQINVIVPAKSTCHQQPQRSAVTQQPQTKSVDPIKDIIRNLERK